MIPTILEFCEKFGVQAAVIAFFIWRDYSREKDLTTRLREVEQEIHSLLLTTIKENTEVNKELIAMLKGRPCLVEK